jgi:glycosyltransferase involved in cell wall biosynthesis
MNLSSPIAPPLPGRTRVLEVVGNAIVGGMEVWVTRFIERLPRDRFTVTVLCPFDGHFADTLRAQGVEVFVTPMGDDPSWSSIMTTCSLVRAAGIDVLHAHLPHAHLLAALVGRLCGKPVVTTVHARHVSPMDLEIHRAAGTHLSAVCMHTYLHALSMGVNAAHLSCIPNGVDTDVFKPAEPGVHEAAGIRAQLGLSAGEPLVGFIGRLSPEKAPEVFLRAALLLRRLLPEAHCVLVGDGPLYGEAAGFVRRFQLHDRVHLLGLRLDMPAVYRELDLVVSTSHTESRPLAVMEAMASGLPVVATRVGGVPDLVEHGETGWLVSARDDESIARRIAQVLATPGERERMGTQARARALARLRLADSVDSTLELLRRMATAAASMSTPRPAPIEAVGGTAHQPNAAHTRGGSVSRA